MFAFIIFKEENNEFDFISNPYHQRGSEKKKPIDLAGLSTFVKVFQIS